MNVVPISSSDQEITADFTMFYTLFPRHEARKDALKAWERMTPADQLAAIVGIASWRRVFIDRGDYRYTPLPATWLRGERWTDELPPEYRAQHASHLPVTSEPAPERTGTIPDHVKALFMKIRGGK